MSLVPSRSHQRSSISHHAASPAGAGRPTRSGEMLPWIFSSWAVMSR